MITIKLEGFNELKSKLGDLARNQLPFALAKTLTATAKGIETRLQAEMASVFKSPSPYVKRATFVQPASKSNLSAVVGIKDMKPSGGTAPSVLLKEHFTGGLRGHKPFEKALEAMGAMPAGYRAIPASGMKLDSYGNPSKRMIVEMLGALRSSMSIWKWRGKKARLVGYFVIQVGDKSHLHPGVYYRPNRGALLCMFIFVQQAAYRKAINLDQLAVDVVAKKLQGNFEVAFANAVETAR